MKRIVFYLLFWILLLCGLFGLNQFVALPSWYLNNLLLFYCIYIGGLGGTLYCLRAVYLNKCVLKRWDECWNVWYYLRPIGSCIGGLVAFVFLKAGLLVLDVTETGGNNYGFLAVAFIAGYNLDNFLKKAESVAHSAWGIAKSRSIDVRDKDDEKNG